MDIKITINPFLTTLMVLGKCDHQKPVAVALPVQLTRTTV